MGITGYAWLKSHTTTHNGLGKPEDFAGKILPCLEINPEGDVLVYRDGVGLAMFDASDVLKSFRCRMEGRYILPPDSDLTKIFMHLAKAVQVSKNDPDTFNTAVIAMSLEKGEYYTEIFR